jgi:selenocysteine lyase/cysteine desulfurase
VDGVPHALVAARLSCEFGIGVRHGCFCAHPYVARLLGLGAEERERFHAAARRHDRSSLPGAVRASAGVSIRPAEIRRLPLIEHTVRSTVGNSGIAQQLGAFVAMLVLAVALF